MNIQKYAKVTIPFVLSDMAKQSKKNKSKTLVINSKESSEELKSLFKNKPEQVIKFYDEDGYELTHPDDIDDLFKRVRMREKEKWLANKKGKKSKRKRQNLPDAQFEIGSWDELLITIRDGSEWVTFTKMYDGKPAINEKFELSYKQLGFKEPSIEFLKICATSNNTASVPYGNRKVKSRVDITFKSLFDIEHMSIVSHPKKKKCYFPLFKINHLDKDGNSVYGHFFSNEHQQLSDG